MQANLNLKPSSLERNVAKKKKEGLCPGGDVHFEEGIIIFAKIAATTWILTLEWIHGCQWVLSVYVDQTDHFEDVTGKILPRWSRWSSWWFIETFLVFANLKRRTLELRKYGGAARFSADFAQPGLKVEEPWRRYPRSRSNCGAFRSRALVDSKVYSGSGLIYCFIYDPGESAN